jgi:hypothetical protein
VATLCPDAEIYSIDETFLSLAGFLGRDLVGIGQDMRATVARWTGMPTCVGIGPTKTLAKLGNAAAKKQPTFRGVCNLTDDTTHAAVMQAFQSRMFGASAGPPWRNWPRSTSPRPPGCATSIRSGRGRCAERVRISPMTDDAQHSVFGQWTGRPELASHLCKPVVGGVMVGMRRIDQRNQHVGIEQKCHQGNSSRSWFTNSGVTGVASGRIGKSGTPLRV